MTPALTVNPLLLPTVHQLTVVFRLVVSEVELRAGATVGRGKEGLNAVLSFVDDKDTATKKGHLQRGEFGPDQRRDAFQILSGAHGGDLGPYPVERGHVLYLISHPTISG